MGCLGSRTAKKYPSTCPLRTAYRNFVIIWTKKVCIMLVPWRQVIECWAICPVWLATCDMDRFPFCFPFILLVIIRLGPGERKSGLFLPLKSTTNKGEYLESDSAKESDLRAPRGPNFLFICPNVKYPCFAGLPDRITTKGIRRAPRLHLKSHQLS